MKKLILATAILLSAAGASANTVITFEEPGFVAMSNSPGASVPVGAQLSNQYLATLGVTFSSGAGYVAVVDHTPGCTICTPTVPNIIGATAAGGTLNYAGVISASFFNVANFSQQATTNFVQVLGDRFPLNSGSAFLEAYGVSGNLLGTVSAPDVGAQGTGPVLSFTGPGIHSVRFYSDNATVGFDNFEFGDLAAVPEPATWGMMILGFFAIGSAMRRRRSMEPAIA